MCPKGCISKGRQGADLPCKAEEARPENEADDGCIPGAIREDNGQGLPSNRTIAHDVLEVLYLDGGCENGPNDEDG